MSSNRPGSSGARKKLVREITSLAKDRISPPTSPIFTDYNIPEEGDASDNEWESDNGEGSLAPPDELDGEDLSVAPRRGNLYDDMPCCGVFADHNDSTFSLVNKRMGKKVFFRFSKEKSLFFLSFTNPIRRFCIRLICTQWFDHFIISIILINCVLLAANYENPNVEYAFAVVYTLEMILKVLARGFVLHKHAYLRDPWNRLDFVVVMFGYLTLVDSLKEFSFIKALRVLRSLRTITVVPGLRIMVNSLLKSLKNLSDVMLLTVFFLAVFAIIGLQLFMGNLKNRCIRKPDDNDVFWWWNVTETDLSTLNSSVQTERMDYISNDTHWIPDAEEAIICAMPGSPGTRQCPLGSSCKQTSMNPNGGYTHFDNFGYAMLTCAQLITLDFWEDVYGKVLGSCGAYYIVYFLFIIFFGSFYLINLVLAVVAISYEQEVLSPQEEKTGLPKLDDDGDECSFVEEDDGGGEDGENHEQNHLGDAVPVPPEKRGFCGALKACCCCCDDSDVTRSTVVVDPENGTMITAGPLPATQETCFEKFMDVWTWFRSHVRSFIYSFWFENGIMLCIVINTLCLALDSPSISKDFDHVLSKINDCLTWIFTTELVIKLVGLLPTEFWKTKWNIFDTIIVVVSLVELNVGSSNSSFNVSGLRSLRVLRVFRLAKSWSTMKALIDIIAESISGLVYLSIILGVVIYTLSVIGMNLFLPRYSEFYDMPGNPEMPRWNYKDFNHSFVLLFRILCGEWIELLYETLDATGGILWPVIFYLGALVLGNFLVLNLFLALLLNAFGEESIKEKSGGADVNSTKVSLSVKIKNKLFNIRKKKHKLASEIRMSSLALSPAEQMKSSCQYRGKPNGNPADVMDGTNNNNNNNNNNNSNSKPEHDHDADEYMSSCEEHEGHDKYSCDDCCQCCMICCRPFCVCCSRFRAAVRRVVEHRAFEWTILFLIMASSLTLAFEDITLEKSPVRKEIVETLNMFYVVVFTIEMCLKLFAFGVFTYFESAWHWIDSLVVAISIVSIVIRNAGVSGLKAIRALRALRPLRAISQWEGMRLSVNALISSIPSFGNVSLVCLVLWLVFCILGVQFFGNKFYKCVVGGEKSDPTIISNKTDCIKQYGEEAWQNSKINFDNTVMAFFALYQVATFEGWMEVMDDAVDSVAEDKQPIFENTFVAYVFFLVFIFVGSFFTLNLLVGVIIDNFNRLKKEYEEKGQLGVLLTPAQRRWMSTFRKMAKTKPIRMVTRPKNKFMKFCYDMSENQKFEVVITIIILLNMVQMAMEHDNAKEQFTNAMFITNYVFTVIYTLEAMLKIIGTRKFYFYKSWNIFDFVIVVFAWLGIAMDSVIPNSVIDPSILRSFRVFRVARILRIIQMAKGIRRLLYTLICSLPALINIGTLLLLIIYIYAVVGVAMFGYVRRQGILNDQVNFEQTPSAIILMTRLATSAGWNDVLDAIMVQEPDCDANLYEAAGQTGDCGFKAFAIAYFSSFVLIAFLIMINMYIAVILDNFSEAQQADEIGIDEDDINLFYEKWKMFDPKASQFLNVSKLRDLVGQLAQPLGIPEVTEDDILQLDIPLYPSDRAHCIDVLQALISRTLGPNNCTDEFDMIKELMAESFRAAFPTLAAEVVETTTKQRLREIRAAIVLQKAFRRFKNYKRNEALDGVQQNKEAPSPSPSLRLPKV